MTENERKVLDEMSDDWAWPFAILAERTGLSRTRVRLIVRSFRDRGMAECGPLYDEDEPFVRGSGYSLTELGIRAQDKMRDEREAA